MYFFNPQMILIHSIKFEWDLESIFSRVKFSMKKMREKTSVDMTDFYSAGSRIKNTPISMRIQGHLCFFRKLNLPLSRHYRYLCLSWKLEMSRAD